MSFVPNYKKNKKIMLVKKQYTEIPTSNITSMIEYKESVFKRVIDKIKSIFAKK